MTPKLRAGTWMSLGAAACLVGAAACDSNVPAALGTRTGQPLLLGLEEGSGIAVGSEESSPLRVRLDTVTGESAYHSSWTLGAGTCLEVTPRSGALVRATGTPIVADYYHVGRVLFVAVGEEGRQELSTYVEPVSYRTVPCPEVASSAAAPSGGSSPVEPPRPEAE
jgi:hypothetical protein